MLRPKSVRSSRCYIKKHRIPDYLERNFQVNFVDVCWSIDITAIPTRQGELHLCAIEDLCSRMIVGFAFGDSPDWRLALRAVKLAFKRRKPHGGIVIHSDSAPPFSNDEYQSGIDRLGVTPSLSNGGCYNNAPIESFFGTLKKERIHWNYYLTRQDARKSTTDYIEQLQRSAEALSVGIQESARVRNR